MFWYKNNKDGSHCFKQQKVTNNNKKNQVNIFSCEKEIIRKLFFEI